jgi:hypothetical protein
VLSYSGFARVLVWLLKEMKFQGGFMKSTSQVFVLSKLECVRVHLQKGVQGLLSKGCFVVRRTLRKRSDAVWLSTRHIVSRKGSGNS